MLKFQKDTKFGKRNNHLSEFLGSHVFELLGIEVHKTFLGEYFGEKVVACKDFVTDGYEFVPFNDVGESTIDTDKEKHQYTYEDIILLLEKNRKLTKVNETVSAFFEIYLVDALLGNFDRHGANWGFLKKEGKYQLAPVFDNGSCLSPGLVNEDEMRFVLENEGEIDEGSIDSRLPKSSSATRNRRILRSSPPCGIKNATKHCSKSSLGST